MINPAACSSSPNSSDSSGRSGRDQGEITVAFNRERVLAIRLVHQCRPEKVLRHARGAATANLCKLEPRHAVHKINLLGMVQAGPAEAREGA